MWCTCISQDSKETKMGWPKFFGLIQRHQPGLYDPPQAKRVVAMFTTAASTTDNNQERWHSRCSFTIWGCRVLAPAPSSSSTTTTPTMAPSSSSTTTTTPTMRDLELGESSNSPIKMWEKSEMEQWHSHLYTRSYARTEAETTEIQIENEPIQMLKKSTVNTVGEGIRHLFRKGVEKKEDKGPRTLPTSTKRATEVPPKITLMARDLIEGRIAAIKGLMFFQKSLIGVTFFGLVFNVWSQTSTTNKDYCDVGIDKYNQTIRYELVSFALSLVTCACGYVLQYWHMFHKNVKGQEEGVKVAINRILVRSTMKLTVIISVIAVITFLISVVFTIELKFGKFECLPYDDKATIIISCLLIGVVAHPIFIFPMIHSFTQL